MSKSACVISSVLLLVAGCGPVAQGSAEPASPASSGDPPPGAEAVETAEASYLAAAESQLAVRRHIAEDLALAAALGEDGQAVLADIEAAEIAFGEETMAEFVEEMSIDLEASSDRARAVAAVAPLPPRTTPGSFEWSGSLFGNTSFMASTWLSFAPQMIQNLAGSETFETQTINKEKTHESDIGNLHERLVLTERITVGGGQGRLVFDVVLSSTAVLTDRASGAEVARRISNDTGHFEVNACPDAQGVGEGRYTIVDQQEVTPAGQASNGGAASTEATFRVLDGEDAHLIQTEVDAAVAAGAHGTSAGAEGGAEDAFDWGARGTYQIVIPASGATTYGDATDFVSQNATPENESQLGTLIAMVNHYLAEAAKAAEKFWRSGECVEMQTDDDTRTVDPGEEIELTAEPIGRFDEQLIDAPVTAAFSGTKSLEPSDSPVDAPATFSFVAGSDDGEKGTIELTQTSRRGIGKKTVVFTVGGDDYRLTGAMLPGVGGFDATKCDGLEGPWRLEYSVSQAGGLASGEITFTLPEGGGAADAHGVFEFSQIGGQADGRAVWDMSGTASVTQPEGGPPILHLNFPTGTVTISGPGGSFSTPADGLVADIALEEGDFCP